MKRCKLCCSGVNNITCTYWKDGEGSKFCLNCLSFKEEVPAVFVRTRGREGVTLPSLDNIPAPEPEMKCTRRLDCALVLDKLIPSLSENQQRVIRLRKTGKKWAHIAEELHITEGSARKHYRRAINTLKREVGAINPHPY